MKRNSRNTNLNNSVIHNLTFVLILHPIGNFIFPLLNLMRCSLFIESCCPVRFGRSLWPLRRRLLSHGYDIHDTRNDTCGPCHINRMDYRYGPLGNCSQPLPRCGSPCTIRQRKLAHPWCAHCIDSRLLCWRFGKLWKVQTSNSSSCILGSWKRGDRAI